MQEKKEPQNIFPTLPRELTKLPVVESIADMSSRQLEDLMRVGFCYVKLPDTVNTEMTLEMLKVRALDFFRQSKAEKLKWAMNENFEGFADRQNAKVPQSIQEFLFSPQQPYGPFRQDGKLIAEIKKIFQDKIALPLVAKIFTILGQADKFPELTDQPCGTLSFIYYPPTQHVECTHGVAAHKDFDLITILWITKPGLQVYFNNQWIDVDPMSGYVVVNLANALELILGKQCTSALHRVILPLEERISIGLFVGPDVGSKLEKPVIDLTTGKILWDSYQEYLQDQFKQQYDEPKEQENEEMFLRKPSSIGFWKPAVERSDITPASDDCICHSGIYK